MRFILKITVFFIMTYSLMAYPEIFPNQSQVIIKDDSWIPSASDWENIGTVTYSSWPETDYNPALWYGLGVKWPTNVTPYGDSYDYSHLWQGDTLNMHIRKREWNHERNTPVLDLGDQIMHVLFDRKHRRYVNIHTGQIFEMVNFRAGMYGLNYIELTPIGWIAKTW